MTERTPTSERETGTGAAQAPRPEKLASASSLPPVGTVHVEGEEDEQPSTFDKIIPSVLDVLLGDPDIDKKITDFWPWKRRNVNVPIRSITTEEFKELQDRWTIRRRMGRSAQTSTELDIQGYNTGIVSKACLDPDFSKAEVRKDLAEKYGNPNLNDDAYLVNKVFLPGEVSMIALAVLDLTGFTDDEEIVKSLKDSS